MMAGRVSVIMTAHNAAAFIRAAIDSALSQSYRDLEVIVCNNGSTDETGSIIDAYRDTRVRSFHQSNLGPAQGRNAAIERSTGEWLAILDADDYWLPRKLEIQIPILDQDPLCGLVYCDAFRCDVAGTIYSRFSSDVEFARGNIFLPLVYEACVSAHSTFIYRASALREVGLFNTNYSICQDYDLLLRVASRFKVDFTPQPLVVYREHCGGTSKNLRKVAAEDRAILQDCLERFPELATTAACTIRRKHFVLTAKSAYADILDKRWLTAASSLLAALWASRRDLVGVAATLHTYFWRRLVVRRLRHWKVRLAHATDVIHPPASSM